MTDPLRARSVADPVDADVAWAIIPSGRDDNDCSDCDHPKGWHYGDLCSIDCPCPKVWQP